jgi:actin related protein 2/3 complex subunit 1A/1B
MQAARIEDKVTCHAWNADRSLLAVCPNNNTVSIFATPASADGPWERVATLSEHDALVTAIAWAPRTNRILTTSQDRNAYVWNLEDGAWKPMLVILRITAAATSVQWSGDEQKFAVGSGAKTVPICYFESENNFWVSKMLKGHSSTIQAVAWHPSMPVVATACTDFRCRVYSAYLKNIDGKAVSTPWGDNPKFGTLFFELESLGWVRDVAFSPAGDTLAFASHNSTVSFVDVASGAPPQVVRLSELPLTRLLFLPDGNMIGVGHGYAPYLFCRTATGWEVAGKIEGKKKEEAKKGNFGAARAMFQAQSNMGQSAAAASSKVETVHSNLVCGMQLFGSNFGGQPTEFTTSGLDGRIAFWTVRPPSAHALPARPRRPPRAPRPRCHMPSCCRCPSLLAARRDIDRHGRACDLVSGYVGMGKLMSGHAEILLRLAPL